MKIVKSRYAKKPGGRMCGIAQSADGLCGDCYKIRLTIRIIFDKQRNSFEKSSIIIIAAPIASADVRLLLSVATESNQRTPSGG